MPFALSLANRVLGAGSVESPSCDWAAEAAARCCGLVRVSACRVRGPWAAQPDSLRLFPPSSRRLLASGFLSLGLELLY